MRPLGHFLEKVRVEGREVPRFGLAEEAGKG
ncbi:MAG: hypothetical protein ACO2OU_02420 [Thermus aquaticus]